MKRILAMLLTVFFSITNNVDIQFSGDDSFKIESYYVITNETQPDYRQLYTQGVQITAADNCTKNTRMGNYLNLLSSEASSGLSTYWIAEDKDHSMTISDVPNDSTFTYSGAGDIIAPISCTVATSATSGGGHSMRLDTVDGKYTFIIDNMERWYCCRYRKESHANDTWIHSVDINGTTINAGQLVGMAQEGTTVTVYDTRTRSKITLSEFYNR